MRELPAMDSPAIESVAKQAWHRPVVTFVPMQATASGKTPGGDDGVSPGSTSTS